MDKQRAVKHDELVHDFETLTTDLDGLLGVLENTLDNNDAGGSHWTTMMQTLKQRGCCVLYFKLVQSYNVAECS